MKVNGTTAGYTTNSGKKPMTLELDKSTKIEKIALYFKKIMETLDLDLDDPSLMDTPERVAKMYVNEIFKGLDNANFPKISFFENNYAYKEIIVIRNITLYSYCEHHFVPFFGKVNVGYLPNNKVLGLSKVNRIVQFLASKPQVQEKLTVEIGNTLMKLLETHDMAVSIEAHHLCVASRGVEDSNSATKTKFFSGRFKKNKYRSQFLASILA
ncbi:GTP cyclohydrolase I FolE [Arenibacter aquaticus]|uniref:GTP cyclohydrolase 1 n=1 Tax=Arenibacter aquaticus TaxID=2489054 RepID=A0A3S0AEP9_9FLAO|nr:GTP cyclohydrolase I FolE [Arenibacter aquaticus]RTE53859.1 GTP cyclohydrolase I FolE [Arenibacter aquaticus]